MGPAESTIRTAFLIPAQRLDVAPVDVPAQVKSITEPPANPPLSSWSGAVSKATVALQSAIKNGDRGGAVAMVAHQSLEAGLAGAVVALTEHLRATESGADACSLFSAVM